MIASSTASVVNRAACTQTSRHCSDSSVGISWMALPTISSADAIHIQRPTACTSGKRSSAMRSMDSLASVISTRNVIAVSHCSSPGPDTKSATSATPAAAITRTGPATCGHLPSPRR